MKKVYLDHLSWFYNYINYVFISLMRTTLQAIIVLAKLRVPHQQVASNNHTYYGKHDQNIFGKLIKAYKQ